MDDFSNENIEKPDNSFENLPEIKVPDRKGLAIASMVLGIISVALFCLWFLTIPCAILAIIFAALSLKSSNRGMAIAGLVLGIIGVGLWVLLFLLAIIARVSFLSGSTSYNL